MEEVRQEVNMFSALANPVTAPAYTGERRIVQLAQVKDITREGRKPRKRPEVANPWKLTPMECKTIAAVAEWGRLGRAAETLGVCCKTIESHLRAIKLKMGVPTTIHAVLKWDRLNRKK